MTDCWLYDFDRVRGEPRGTRLYFSLGKSCHAGLGPWKTDGIVMCVHVLNWSITHGYRHVMHSVGNRAHCDTKVADLAPNEYRI